MNGKKSLISLVAALAISSSVYADSRATYLPLTTTTNDSSWTLFGVNGYSNGEPSNAIVGPTSFSSGLTELDDADATDDLATSGLSVSGGNLGALQGLSSSGLNSVKVGVDISGVTFQPTEAVRSMYIKVNSSTPNVKFYYKAALEGKTMEIILNNSTTTVYTVTISDQSTYNNAATAVVSSSNTTSTASDLSDIVTVVDANSSDNPINPENWDKTKHYQAYNTTDDSVTFYRFDSVAQEWKIFKNVNSTAANDFTKLNKGRAYWGRIDLGNANANLDTNDNDGATNLILGISGNTNQSQLPGAYVDDNNKSILAPGWNMLAFDDIKPYIRHAATGLVVSGVNNGEDLNITDESGVNVASLTLTGASAADIAKRINKDVESLRLRGFLPKAFYLKAFATNNANEIVLISDDKFGLRSASTIGAIKTLNNKDPFVNAASTAVANLSAAANTVYSVYGEYAVMMNVLTGAASADANASSGGTSKIIFGDSVNSDHAAIAITTAGTSTLGQAETNIEAEPTLTPQATQVDTNFDGTPDMLIVANDTPFYVRDDTFTRVFTIDTSNADGTKTFKVAGAATANIAPALNATPSAVATLINAQKATTKVLAGTNAANNKLIVFSTDANTLDLKDTVSATDDFLRTATSSDNVAKGAVKGVFSLDELSKKAVVQHAWVYTAFRENADVNATDGVTVNFNGISTDVNVTFDVNDTTSMTTAQRLDFFDRLVAEINKQAIAAGAHAYAYHDYTEAINDFTNTKVHIDGMDVNASSLTEADAGNDTGTILTSSGDTTAATAETLGTLNGDLVDDLKFNAVYTPNYAKYGPLYTMYDSGYDVLAILKATTDFNTTSITWDSIDLTRNEDDWFVQNEFNVFNVNLASGYWVYLADKTPNSIAISNPSFTPTYSYYFDNDTGRTTTNNIVGGQLRVTVDGLTDTSNTLAGRTSNVYAIVGGEEIQMKINSGTEYTADITKFESVDFKENANPISFTIRATDGKGKSVTLNDALKFDYAKPAAPTVTYPNASSAIFTSTSTDVKKFYVFKNAIPEDATARSAAVVADIDATGGTATSNICSNFNFGVLNTLRIVAADNADGSGNISDAAQIKYTSLFKGASVITHKNDGIVNKATLPTVYDDTCTLAATQPSGSENTGVSIKALVIGKTASIAYVADPNVSFNTNVAWDSIYTIGGTEVIQLQNVEVYAGDKFLIEYEGNLYEGTFPLSQAAADATIAAPTALTQVASDNTELVPATSTP